MEPKSLLQIITEDEFLPLVHEPCANFFKIGNSFVTSVEHKQDITRKFYSNLIQESEFLESFFDEYGARENKNWMFFSEYTASIRNLAI